MKIVILIPVHNEQASIGGLLDAVREVTRKIPGHDIRMLVIDGQSTDQTSEIVRGKMATDPSIQLIIEKEKQGLGAAYLYGMNYAMDTLGADAFMEFDGDFQHDPKDIPKLVQKLDEGYDYIIGSRYIPGGTIPREWPWYRKLLSWGGNAVVRVGLGLQTHDNTSGFKLTRVKGFRDALPLSVEKLLSRRHAYKIHLLYAMIRAGAKTAEVPIQFLNRYTGVSKSTVEDIIESLKVVGILRKRQIFGRSSNKDKF